MKSIVGIFIAILLSASAMGQIAISPKGDKITIDSSKWKMNGTSAYFKLAGNVGIGNTSPAAKLVIDNSGSTSLQALKLKYPFSGATTDSLLTWNNADSSVRRISAGSIKTSLSGILAAGASNTIDNLNNAQTWGWSSANTQNALTLSGNALTTGSLLSLTGSSALTSGSLLDIMGQTTAATAAGLLTVINSASANSGMVARIQANSNTLSGLTVLANGNVGIGTTTPFAGLTNDGATAFTITAIGNLATGGVIGTATATIDSGTNFNITQTTAGQTLTLPSPTVTTAGRIAYINNTGTAAFTMLGASVPASQGITAMWTGSAWTRLDGSTTTGTALSAISAATGANTIDNLTNAQTWNWSTASTQTPLTLTGNALTTGDLLKLTGAGTLTSGSLVDASAAISASSTRGILYVANTAASTTGMVARIQANSTASSGITVLANGSVGIGTTSPSFTVPANTGSSAPVFGVDGGLNAANINISFQVLTDAATIVWDVTKGAHASVTLHGAGRTLSMSNARPGMMGYLIVKQDATGGRTITALPAGSKTAGGTGGVPYLTTSANAADMLFFIYDGTNYYWSVSPNFN